MNIIVTGAASGLGREIVLALAHNHENHIIGVDIERPITDIENGSVDEADVRIWAKWSELDSSMDNVTLFPCFNVASQRDWDVLAGRLKDYGFDVIDGIVNCAGINRNEWFEDVTAESFSHVMQTNAFSFVLSGQALLESLKQSLDEPFILNIVSNAAHIPMTSSLAYNASKAAGLMITKQMAHELTPKYGITVFSISPNKLEGTGMSKAIEDNVVKVRGWTPEFAKEYQKKALMHGRETNPACLAWFIADLVNSGHYRFMSGTDIPYGK